MTKMFGNWCTTYSTLRDGADSLFGCPARMDCRTSALELAFLGSGQRTVTDAVTLSNDMLQINRAKLARCFPCRRSDPM